MVAKRVIRGDGFGGKVRSLRSHSVINVLALSTSFLGLKRA